MPSITLPWPSASLSGHNTGHWRSKATEIKTLRTFAKLETFKAKPVIPAEGDIPIHFHMVPANNRGDRVNYPNRLKPLIDGVADGLGVNDKRFNPSWSIGEPEKPGRVEVHFGGEE